MESALAARYLYQPMRQIAPDQFAGRDDVVPILIGEPPPERRRHRVRLAQQQAAKPGAESCPAGPGSNPRIRFGGGIEQPGKRTESGNSVVLKRMLVSTVKSGSTPRKLYRLCTVSCGLAIRSSKRMTLICSPWKGVEVPAELRIIKARFKLVVSRLQHFFRGAPFAAVRKTHQVGRIPSVGRLPQRDNETNAWQIGMDAANAADRIQIPRRGLADGAFALIPSNNRSYSLRDRTDLFPKS